MKVGVIGAGSVGTALAKRLVPAGHEVMLSYARDVEKLKQAATRYRAKAGTPLEAVEFADVVALTVPWVGIDEALNACGSLAGKIVWDCTNALKPDLSGLAIGTTTSGAEQIAAKASGARIVKAIPPFAELMHSADPTVGGKPVGVFMCGDDGEAKAVVRPLLEALPTDVVDAGGLERARFIEPAAFLLIPLGYSEGFGSRIGLNLLRL
ncbi:NAD(P)-binding domain-containing protein [Brevundimonas sp.]|uniref:NADPH-dependent F420 reductase n=1 Tax=Brevundimonas sp. TaxID=1871086 RepID=UPI002615F98B|nr:NAD(P)-binding domain-containing protein [Brevundimonas sp.]